MPKESVQGIALYTLKKSNAYIFRNYVLVFACVVTILFLLWQIVSAEQSGGEWTDSYQCVMSIFILIFLCLLAAPWMMWDPRLLEVYQQGILVTERRDVTGEFEINAISTFWAYSPGKKRFRPQYIPMHDIRQIESYTDSGSISFTFPLGLVVVRKQDGSWVALEVWTEMEPVIRGLEQAFGPLNVGNKELGKQGNRGPGTEGSEIERRKRVSIKYDDMDGTPK